MPRSKTEGLLLSIILSAVMIYVMAALNNNIQIGSFSAYSWVLALKRFPLGFVVGILCDLCICTPLSRKIVMKVTAPADKEMFKVLILRFSMVVLMTIAMTVFSVVISGHTGIDGILGFFKYFPYNFTIALPIQMLIVAPMALQLARKTAGFINRQIIRE